MFSLNAAGYLHANLDGMGPDLPDADTIASAVLYFREEIKTILRPRAVLH